MTAGILEMAKLAVAWLFRRSHQPLPLPLPPQHRGMRDWEDDLKFVDTGNHEHQEQLERFDWILALPEDDDEPRDRG